MITLLSQLNKVTSELYMLSVVLAIEKDCALAREAEVIADAFANRRDAILALQRKNELD